MALQQVALKDLRGANYYDMTLMSGKDVYDPADIAKYVPLMKSLFGFNLMRLVINWEDWTPAAAQQTNQIIDVANDNGIFVIVSPLVHFNASSKFLIPGTRSARGFPPSEVGAFTNPDDFIRSILYNTNPNGIWDRMAQQQITVMQSVGNRPNVIGWEIMNEPIGPKVEAGEIVEAYNKVSKCFTYIAQRMIPHMGGRYLVFTDLTHGGVSTGIMHLIAPRIANYPILYTPHHYKESSLNMAIFLDQVKSMRGLGLDVDFGGLGEWATQTPQNTNDKPTMIRFLQKLKAAGCPWTYWAFRHFNAGIGNKLIDENGQPHNPEGVNMIQALKEVYGDPIAPPSTESDIMPYLFAAGVSLASYGVIFAIRRKKEIPFIFPEITRIF